MQQTAFDPSGKIKHVIYILQDGRTVDNLFQGYPGADTVSHGRISDGKRVALDPVGLKAGYGIEDDSGAFAKACNGTGKLPGTDCRMDGFNKEYVGCGGPSPSSPPCPNKHPQYVYVPHDESRPYFDMANEWVLADNLFQSQLDGSFTAGQYTIAAQAHSSVDLPTGGPCGDGSEDQIATINQQRQIGDYEPACFNYQTLGDELDRAKLSWRYYFSEQFDSLSSYAYVKHIYDGPDWKRDIVSPSSRFLTDVAAGKLATFTWIAPNTCTDSDRPVCRGGYGPSWVAALVNAVGKSKFWDSSAIFVQWTTWGGLYDHVPPRYVNYDGLGFRVPLLVISPYAKPNYVSHVQYETASTLRFAEDVFGLGQLSAADRRATSPAADCFDFSQQPRKVVRIQAPKGPKFFLHQRTL